MALRCEHIFRITMMVLLPLMMVFISQLYLIKFFLLGIIAITVPKRFFCSKNLIMLMSAYLLLGFWGIMIGVLNFVDNPFISITTSVVYPLFFLPIIAQLNKPEDYETVIKIMFFAHVFIVVYDLIYAFSIIYGFDFPNIYSINDERTFTYYGTSSRMNFVNLNTITYTTPVFLMLWFTGYRIGIHRYIQIAVILLTLFLFILSGRRSLMLIFVMIPFVAVVFREILPTESRMTLNKTLKVLVAVICLFLLYVIAFFPDLCEGYVKVFFKAFDSGQEPVKFAQQKALLSAFCEKPFCGHGDGAFFYEPFPGRQQYMSKMELQYHLKLAQTGVVGFVLLLFAYGVLLVYGAYLAYKKRDIIFVSFIFGLFFMLVANATNPVMASFDLLVPYFLCLAKINTNSLFPNNN